MVVKTEKCAFSEYWVFPGHGMKFVRKDGQPLVLSGSKTKSLYMQRLKPSKLMWTQVIKLFAHCLIERADSVFPCPSQTA